MKTNRDKLIKHAVSGSIAHPTIAKAYWTSFDGQAINVPSVGSITYDIEIGDNCLDLIGDHVEPGVSIKNTDKSFNMTLNYLACIGNKATVISGDAKGAEGYVTGKHGGVDHVILYFKQEDLNKMVIGDNIQIKAFGLGLKLLDYPSIKLFNLDPEYLDKLNLTEENGTLSIPVTKEIPAYLMGSGLGSANIQSGDYDIMMHDSIENEKYKLQDLRFGDLVAIKDHYAAYGPHYKKNSLSIGVIVHSDSQSAGHGPGVVIIMSDQEGKLKYTLDQDVNIKNFFV